jgi:flagellar hook-associated protein 2
MATATSLSSPGIGSGLDVNTIISGLMAVEQRPITLLQRAEAKLQAKLSGFGQIQSLASSLNDALKVLTLGDVFKQTIANSSDSTAVSAAATVEATAASYSITVQKLASTQTLVSGSGQFDAPTDVVGTGTLTLRLGAWNSVSATDTTPTTFSPKAGSSDIAITIDAASQTLEGVRDKINAAAAGVTASIVNDASGSRLYIRSNETGRTSGFRLTVAETGAPGLGRLGFDPENAINDMTYAQAAANSRATINGIAVTSTTDAVSDAITGVSLRLGKVSTTPVNVTVSSNTEAAKAAINRLASAYNDLAKFVGEQTSYNASTKKAGQFQGDSTVVGLLNQVRSLLTQSSNASATFSNMSSIGLELQKDGSIKVNSTKLDNAVKNLPELSKALGNVSGDPTSAGLAKRMNDYTEGLLAATGSFPTRTKSIQDSIAANTKDQQRVSDRLAQTEQRLRAQYTALDRTMSKYNALNKYVTQQFANYNVGNDR